MDSINFYNIKAEKVNAVRKYRRRWRVANFLRFLEICLVLALISRFSAQIPFAVKNSGEYFRFLSLTLINPRFVFFIGNAIVITLFAKSGQFSGSDSGKTNSSSEPSGQFSGSDSGKTNSSSGSDPYEDFIKKNEKNQKNHSTEIETQISNHLATDDAYSFEGRKNYRRSQSDNSGSGEFRHEKHRRELRRSETESGREKMDSGEGVAKSSLSEEDKMSNEEFRKTVEAFIARQQRFRMEED